MSFKIMDNFDLGNVFWMFFHRTLFTDKQCNHTTLGESILDVWPHIVNYTSTLATGKTNLVIGLND